MSRKLNSRSEQNLNLPLEPYSPRSPCMINLVLKSRNEMRHHSIYICCGASERQHKHDLRRIYRRQYEFSNSPLFTKCIVFNQTALRHLLRECIAPRTARGCHTVKPFLMQHAKVCKSGRFNNCDILILNLVCSFLAVSPPWSNSQMKRKGRQ